MIEYVKGELAELTPAYAVVEAAGVGYGLNITLNTYTAIQGRKDVRLYAFELSVKTLTRCTVSPRSRKGKCSFCL